MKRVHVACGKPQDLDEDPHREGEAEVRAEVCTVGGYEPVQSPLAPEAEPLVLAALGRLADRVIGDVFESFSKHPEDVKKREAEEKARRTKSRN